MPQPSQTEISNPKPEDIAAVAIVRHPGQDHLGCFYVADNKTMRQLHLEGHLRLKDQPLDSQFSTWVVPSYPKLLLEQAAAIARRFVKLRPHGKVPYGFDQPFLAVKRSGELKEDLVGLTCASLVVGIFDTARTPLIDPSGWNNDPGDNQWQANIASHLERRYPSQAKALLEQNGATRYRPIHVFGGASCEKPPATKPVCVQQIRIFSYSHMIGQAQEHLVRTIFPSPGVFAGIQL